jgi:transposase
MIRHKITDESWERIKDLLPLERSKRRGRPAKDNRTMTDAILWILYTGAPWRDLPEEYGPWNSVYSRFRLWIEKGIWRKMLDKLSEDRDMENIMIDGSYVRVHQHGTGARGGSRNRLLVAAVAGLRQKFMWSWMGWAIL